MINFLVPLPSGGSIDKWTRWILFTILYLFLFLIVAFVLYLAYCMIFNVVPFG